MVAGARGPGSPWVSMLWSILVFISVCRGAAVDAPSQTVATEPSTATTSTPGETEREHPRFSRSVPGHESVLNFDYVGESDAWAGGQTHNSYLTRDQPHQRHQLPVNSLSAPRDSRGRTWQLEPQVGKQRGKRVRGQSSHYRSMEQEQERAQEHYRSMEQEPELRALENSLDAVERGAATTMLSRQQRNGRRYDVPQIGRM